jgi:hypothetical protein
MQLTNLGATCATRLGFLYDTSPFMVLLEKNFSCDFCLLEISGLLNVGMPRARLRPNLYRPVPSAAWRFHQCGGGRCAGVFREYSLKPTQPPPI